MNTNILKASVTGISLIAFGLSGIVWAEGCIDANPKYPITSKPAIFVDPEDTDTYVAPDESIPVPSVTAFDGNLTCDSTSGYFGGFIAGGSGTETFTSPDRLTQFKVTSYIDINGKAVWNVIHDETLQSDSEVIELRGIDATIAASSQGSKGCNTTFGVDAGSGVTAYEKKNGSLVTSDLYVCANTAVDPVPAPPPPSPAVIKGCVLENNDVIDIYGVTIQCIDVPPGEQRTIFVAKDTENDDNHTTAQPVPGFGFTDENGVIDFNNVCICNGPDTVVDEILCDPSPLFDGEEIDALEPCTVTDAVPALDITIQNPRCVTYGGSRRCY